MTVGLEAAQQAPARVSDESGWATCWDAEVALAEMIAAHRAALVALAPHQEERAARIETGWHMEHLGVLLCLRDAQTHKTPPGMVPNREGPEESTGTDRSTR